MVLSTEDGSLDKEGAGKGDGCKSSGLAAERTDGFVGGCQKVSTISKCRLETNVTRSDKRRIHSTYESFIRSIILLIYNNAL